MAANDDVEVSDVKDSDVKPATFAAVNIETKVTR